jgi:hypothetical protein
MYQAELHGKLPHFLQKSEDILTSYVFSFFKYSNRRIYLHNYLSELGINVSEYEAQNAEFEFWPSFEDLTEPDLVLIVGNFYILIEAKYTSSFGKANQDIQAQLVREFYGGKSEADKLEKKFVLLAITAHPFYDPSIFLGAPDWLVPKILWTNWQRVTIFLERNLEEENQIGIAQIAFAEDLKNLLIHKRLRTYIGKEAFHPKKDLNQLPEGQWFFDTTTAKYRDVFEGFSIIISDIIILETDTLFFFAKDQENFFEIKQFDKIEPNKSPLFFRR